MAAPENTPLNSSHWGAFEPVVNDGRLTSVRPFARDPDPSQVINSLPDAVRHPSRVAQPAVRSGWLKHGPGGAREGRCAVLTENLRPGVIQISTGAWYDPIEPGVTGSLDKHGNPTC